MGNDFWSRAFLFLVAIAGGVVASACAADSVLYTRHNLSVNAPARTPTKRVWTDVPRDTDIKSAGLNAEERVCVFCHTPHHASTVTPLWSRETADDRGTLYELYQSDTVQAGKLQQPFGGSKLCLSCHDGTIAMNTHIGDALPFTSLQDKGGAAVTKMPAGDTNLGIDLRNDHPISFAYADFLGPTSELNDPAQLQQRGVRLESGFYVQCTSCHDPHKDPYGNFLVLDNSAGSPLCTACHNKSGWTASSHQSGGAGPKALEIAANGCENCHRPHSAPGAAYLLQYKNEEDNCLSKCHNGSSYSSDNMKARFGRPYTHPMGGSLPGTHQSNEDPATAPYHVECVDCHNPHQVNSTSPSAPYDGRLKGIKVAKLPGGNFEYAAKGYEFRVCYKCHATNHSTFKSITEPLPPPRQIDELDESLRFNRDNPSVHPVMVDRVGTGSSLKSNLQATMVRITCTDCHDSHGADYSHLLPYRYEQNDYITYSSANYAICFRCHEETFVLSASSGFPRHAQHVINGRVPCSFCHDPHGVSKFSGTPATTSNHAHLINFDASKVDKATASYDAGLRSCSVSCHTAHVPPIANPQNY